MTAHEWFFLAVLPGVLWWYAELLCQPDAPKIVKRLRVLDTYVDNQDMEREVTWCLVKAAWPFRTYHL